jgi:hypothetical protein
MVSSGPEGRHSVPPTFELDAFNCPHCGAYANQRWFQGWYHDGQFHQLMPLQTAQCDRCQVRTVWWDGRMVYPAGMSGPLPSEDLPDDVLRDFEEARSIANASPRGAAALLRLCVQKLCVFLGQPGENINADIRELVKAGLPPRIQKALDIVRVVGNNAVHPGAMSIEDDPVTAAALFGLVNAIAEVMITQPKEIDALYESLPEGARDQIDRRDGDSQRQ